ncbi:MAG: hypothetical protein A4E40_00703 [Methanoregulaceae archaeon PtaU1.Bin059]|nr:MAG: hypothetical protein A4E40_00703 [Methanoregulaceae archaeon PtaU1.Bin059]
MNHLRNAYWGTAACITCEYGGAKSCEKISAVLHYAHILWQNAKSIERCERIHEGSSPCIYACDTTPHALELLRGPESSNNVLFCTKSVKHYVPDRIVSRFRRKVFVHSSQSRFSPPFAMRDGAESTSSSKTPALSLNLAVISWAPDHISENLFLNDDHLR